MRRPILWEGREITAEYVTADKIPDGTLGLRDVFTSRYDAPNKRQSVNKCNDEDHIFL